MKKQQQTEAADSNPITRDHLTANSRVLFDGGRLAIHEDGVMVLQPDGISWAKEPFEAHLPQPETAAGDNSAD